MSHSMLCRIAIGHSRMAKGIDRFPPGLSLRLQGPRPAPPRAPVRKRTLYTPVQMQGYQLAQPLPPPPALHDIPVVVRSSMDLDDDYEEDMEDPFNWQEHIYGGRGVDKGNAADNNNNNDTVIMCDEPEEMLLYQIPPSSEKTIDIEIVLPPAPAPYDPEKASLAAADEEDLDLTEGGTVIPIPPMSMSMTAANDAFNPTDEDLIEQIELLTGPIDASRSWGEGVRVFGEVLRFGGLGARPEARVRYHRARYLVECGEQEAVLDDLVRALDLDPRCYPASRALAALLRTQGAPTEAFRLLETSILVAKHDNTLPWSDRDRVVAQLQADLSKP